MSSANGPLFTETSADTAAHRLVEWFVLRLGNRGGPRAGDYALNRKRIFILPSRAGMLFAGAMLTMLLAAINYSLSLGYVLTFVLASVGLVSMLHTYRNLAGLILRPGRGDPVQLDYRMEKTPGGWKIYDLNVLGVWLVETYRTQFAQEVSAKGIDGLIASMAQRNQTNAGSAKS